MKRNPLVAFTASLQWADVLKVVSRGTPRPWTSVTWGIRRSVYVADKDEEGEVPNIEACTFVGVDF